MGYSVYALTLDLVSGHSVSRMLWLSAGVAVLATSVVVARRGDDRRGFVLAMAAVIACSPIAWLHYFALLLVVVAVAERALGPAWFVPLLMFASEEITRRTTFQASATIGAAAVTVGVALRVTPPTKVRALASPPHLAEGSG